MKKFCINCIKKTKWIEFVVSSELVCSQCLTNNNGRYIFVENGEKLKKFDPDYISHPCDTLDEFEIKDGIKSIIRRRVDRDYGGFEWLIRNLVKQTDLSVGFWMNRICNYFKGKAEGKKEFKEKEDG